MTVTTPSIAPIETIYAGRCFRSRLEARWAAFFDFLGAQWEYQPETLDVAADTRYRPTFHLPDMDGLLVEVKGRMDPLIMEKILSLTSTWTPVLVLRDLPRPGELGPHHYLYARRPTLQRIAVNFAVGDGGVPSILPSGWPACVSQSGRPQALIEETGAVNNGVRGAHVLIDREVSDAFAAARSERFESWR